MDGSNLGRSVGCTITMYKYLRTAILNRARLLDGPDLQQGAVIGRLQEQVFSICCVYGYGHMMKWGILA